MINYQERDEGRKKFLDEYALYINPKSDKEKNPSIEAYFATRAEAETLASFYDSQYQNLSILIVGNDPEENNDHS